MDRFDCDRNGTGYAPTLRNAPLSNDLMVNTIARINDMSQTDGLFVESLAAAMSQTTPDAEEGLKAFLEKRAPNFR